QDARLLANVLVLVGRLPLADLIVFAARDAEQAVGGDGHAVDAVLMVGERQDRFLGGEVPDLGGLVAAAGDEVLAIGGEGDAEDLVGVVFDGMLQLAAGEIPDADDGVATAGGQLLAVVADGQGEDRVVGFEQFLDDDGFVVDAIENEDAADIFALGVD